MQIRDDEKKKMFFECISFTLPVVVVMYDSNFNRSEGIVKDSGSPFHRHLCVSTDNRNRSGKKPVKGC